MMRVTIRALVAAGTTIMAVAGLGCQREPQDQEQDVRGELHALLDDVEQVVRDEIDILEDLVGRPGEPTLKPIWRDRLAVARGEIERLTALRSEVEASTTAEIEGEVAERVLSELQEIRRALKERIRNVREEVGGSRPA